MQQVSEEKDKQQIQYTKIDPESMDAKEAFFSLVAIKMMKLSKKYQKSLAELHNLFYMVSCDFDVLEHILEQEVSQMQDGADEATVLPDSQFREWKVLEDLAIGDAPDSEAYKHVVELRGQREVLKRRVFLGKVVDSG